jgi:Drought induced 19 protein (Di19), zinc-binding
LERKGLLEHVNKKHKGKPAVCPICVVQEYGDPNYVSQNLGSHLNLRHKFDMDTYVQYEESEDAILQRVLMESMMQ